MPEFALAILLLLATPGPTNTLMALAGYERGWLRATPLISAELLGYLLVIVPVATLAAPIFLAHPALALWAKLVAGAWVLFLAIKLWSVSPSSVASKKVTAGSVFVTTCLNPKALIIGLVIMPHEGLLNLLPWLAAFALLVVGAANGWIFFGALLKSGRLPALGPATISRVAAAGLFAFAMILAGTSLHALA